ncbi:MAG: hypothetical protein PHT75_01640 [Bacilli bacterium]|nr:hypothetical protein [Bacilli bacterium]MDD3304816.1 hypothetical protein [Bacilli bacterium]MDD4053403.1 hypothetical protein [Bacilli bacterium]
MIDDELKSFSFYLKAKGYDDDVCDYILKSFESLNNHYQEYIKFDPEIIARDTFIRRYIEVFKGIDKFVVLRDVNEDKDFERKVTPLRGNILSVGYKKDSENRYIVTHNNPEYYCLLLGLTNNIAGEVTILFDETIKERMPLLKETLIHELTHVYQRGFELPWFVMNRDLFIRVLREGHAMREARYVNGLTPSFYTIPFNYNEVENKFIRGENNDYGVYKYLYYKLETLLGHEFMSEWAIAGDNNKFLSKARKQLDGKYGENTFKKIYENIESILFSLSNFSNDDIELIAEQQQNISLLYSAGNDISLDISYDEHDIIFNILNDEDLFKEAYNRERESILNAKQCLEKSRVGKPSIIKKLNEKIKNLNEENYRISLEHAYDSVQDEIDARKDIKCFKSIMTSNVATCKRVINNPKALTDAIVSLESITLKCLMLDMDRDLEDSNIRFKKYRYYLTNMGSRVFDYKVMSNVKKNLDFLAMKMFFQAQNVIDDESKEKSIK